MNDGNFREAFDGYRRLCLNPAAGVTQVGQDLVHAVQCLNNLGRIQEFDELVESAVGVHKDNWRLLQTAAQQYLNAQHHGFMIAGKYERGGRRGGGQAVNSVERARG